MTKLVKVLEIGDKVEFVHGEYKVVGYWGSDIVLAPMGLKENQVLIYSENEIKDFIKEEHIVSIKKPELY